MTAISDAATGFAKTGGWQKPLSYAGRISSKIYGFYCRTLREQKKSGNRLFGGEPLMNFSSVKAAINRAKEIEKEKNKNFRFTLTTNVFYLQINIDYLNREI